MEEQSYWESITQSRVNRRRVLAATALGAGSLALSLSCGGDGDGGDDSGSGKSLVAKLEDSTSRAKAGGVLKDYATADVTSFDALASSTSASNQVANRVYSRLLRQTLAKYPEEASLDKVEGDLAESFELSADKLQITLKLRQGPKWDPQAPTSSRAIDAQDVLFSWDKFARLSNFRGTLAYNTETAPLAPIESVSAPDSRTIIMKMHQPFSDTLGLMTSNLYVYPRESDGGFDPRGTIRGYGPYFMDEYQAGAYFTWRKNPDYHVKGRPYVDKIEQPIIPEFAAVLAQFRAGKVYQLAQVFPLAAGGAISLDNVFQQKQEIPQTEMRESGWVNSGGTARIIFGYNGDSPWKDERMRQAVSLIVDRELLIDTVGSRQKFKDQGIDLRASYMSADVSPSSGELWLDPTDEKKFGPNAKYLKYNMPEAKKLMAAAGFANGVDTILEFNGEPNYGPEYAKLAEVAGGVLSDGGVRAKLTPVSYQETLAKLFYGYAASNVVNAGKALPGRTGLTFLLGGQSHSATGVTVNWHHTGRHWIGWTDGKVSPEKGEPELDRIIEAMYPAFDFEKKKQLFHDFQRYAAKLAISVQFPGYASLGFNLDWPVLGNHGFFRPTSVMDGGLNLWIDDSKPPLAKT